MIQAADLRVGNWIRHAGEDWEIFQKVTAKNILEFERFEDDPEDDVWSRGGPNDWFFPIPLTPDILEKAGFPIQNGVRWHEGSKILLGWGEESPHYYTFKYNLLADSVKIRYVHQLQNLFYSLTGEELTINL